MKEKPREIKEKTVGLPLMLHARMKLFCCKKGLKIKIWLVNLIEKELNKRGE
jgi:hypothetical protein